MASAHGFEARAEGPRVGHYDYVNIDDDLIGVHHHPKWHKFGITRSRRTRSRSRSAPDALSRAEAIAELGARGAETPWPDIDAVLLPTSGLSIEASTSTCSSASATATSGPRRRHVADRRLPRVRLRLAGGADPRAMMPPTTALDDVDAVVDRRVDARSRRRHVLDALGRRAGRRRTRRAVGGADGSFTTAAARTFDHGLHVLDADRSADDPDLFVAAVDGEVHRTVLRRAIVLRGDVVPYAPTREQLPARPRRAAPAGELVDDLGDDLPTRDRLAGCYGRAYVDLVFDEVLPSFPSEARHLAFGVDEARLLVNVYPWFFPRVRWARPRRRRVAPFHDRLRAGVPQEVLCPPGGFGALRRRASRRRSTRSAPTVVVGVGDLDVEVEPGTHTVASVTAGGRRYVAEHYVWAAGWPQLCALLDLPCQDVGDRPRAARQLPPRPSRPRRPSRAARRRSDASASIASTCPDELRGTGEPLLQVEFAVPVADERWPQDRDTWRRWWLEATAGALGLLDADHRVEEFDFRSFVMHFNGFGVEGEPLRDADPQLLRADTNIVPVVPSMANLNLNRWVPRAVRDLGAVVDAGGASDLRFRPA